MANETPVIDIKVDAEQLIDALNRAPKEIQRHLKRAGLEAGKKIINTKGLKRYPPVTSANSPPTPYYIRGRGTQYASGNKGESERYGTQWNVKYNDLHTSVTLGNRASYAKFLADDEDQSRAMAKIGWRKLKDVAEEKIAQIRRIYEAWIAKGLRKAGLK